VSSKSTPKDIKNIVEIAVILLFCGLTLAFDYIKIDYVANELHNKYLSKIIQQSCGGIGAILLMKRLGIRLFGKPQHLLYLIPCLLIAIDNFQFSSYFNGHMQLIHKEPMDFILFGLYCLSVGLFEECIFRGVIFTVFAGLFSKDKKGLLFTFVASSVTFGLAHIFNGSILQVGYTILTGGLFGFALMKTKNIFCAAFVHALYNFGGLLFETVERFGLGNGVVFDMGTVITMAIVSVVLGAFVLYFVWKYSAEEQVELYQKLGVSMKK
jgi:membrane protease YdiL (CAAX protease family)